jgi:hypothetical protein
LILCCRILPDNVAKTMFLVSSCTLNIVLGNTSVTLPSSLILSILGMIVLEF